MEKIKDMIFVICKYGNSNCSIVLFQARILGLDYLFTLQNDYTFSLSFTMQPSCSVLTSIWQKPMKASLKMNFKPNKLIFFCSGDVGGVAGVAAATPIF